jgi:hypothetical protein
MHRLLLVSFLLAWLAAPAAAGPADVTAASVGADAEGTFTFIVTVRHADQGWHHYTDRWEVLTPDGRKLGERILYHPHVSEQPFTRQVSGIAIPRDITSVVIRAHDSVHGFSGAAKTVALPER